MDALNPVTAMLSPDLVHFLLANHAAGANFWNPTIMPFAPMLGTPSQHPPPEIAAPRAAEPPKPPARKEPPPPVEKPIHFEMGSLPTSTYYPTHFMRGTQLLVADGQMKRVEELSSDDFLKCAAESDDVIVNASIVRSIRPSAGSVTIVFETGVERQQIPLKCQSEHPFFVLGKGWCSCQPRRSGENYGLDCALLQKIQVNDVCIVLTRKEDEHTEHVTDIVTAERDFENFSQRAALREQIAEIYYEHVSGRVSAPPERIVTNPPASHRRRRVSE